MTDKPKKSEPTLFWNNYMAMHSTEALAKEWIPKAEHEDIRCYVRKDSFDALRDERDTLKLENEELRRTLKFTMQGLEMWKRYQSPGNIAEIEDEIRTALKGQK